jgi:hypothetical protein
VSKDAGLTTYSVGCEAGVTGYCPDYFTGYTYKVNPTRLNIAFTDHAPDGEGADL